MRTVGDFQFAVPEFGAGEKYGEELREAAASVSEAALEARGPFPVHESEAWRASSSESNRPSAERETK